MLTILLFYPLRFGHVSLRERNILLIPELFGLSSVWLMAYLQLPKLQKIILTYPSLTCISCELVLILFNFPCHICIFCWQRAEKRQSLQNTMRLGTDLSIFINRSRTLILIKQCHSTGIIVSRSKVISIYPTREKLLIQAHNNIRNCEVIQL